MDFSETWVPTNQIKEPPIENPPDDSEDFDVNYSSSDGSFIANESGLLIIWIYQLLILGYFVKTIRDCYVK